MSHDMTFDDDGVLACGCVLWQSSNQRGLSLCALHGAAPELRAQLASMAVAIEEAGKVLAGRGLPQFGGLLGDYAERSRDMVTKTTPIMRVA